MDAFCEALRKWGIVRHACEQAKIGRTTAYRWRKKYKTFADRWDDALEDATDSLEMIARARAVRKVNPSDRLLVLLLKAHRPEKFGDTQRHEHTGKDGGPIEAKVTISAEERDRAIAALAEYIESGLCKRNDEADGALGATERGAVGGLSE